MHAVIQQLDMTVKGLFGEAGPGRTSSAATDYLTPKASGISDIMGRSGSFPDFGGSQV